MLWKICLNDTLEIRSSNTDNRWLKKSSSDIFIRPILHLYLYFIKISDWQFDIFSRRNILDSVIRYSSLNLIMEYYYLKSSEIVDSI